MSSVIDLSARPGERRSDAGPGQPQGSGEEGSLLATLCDHRFVLLTPTNVAFGLMTALFPAVVAPLYPRVPPCTPLYPLVPLVPLFHDGSLPGGGRLPCTPRTARTRVTPSCPVYPLYSPHQIPFVPRLGGRLPRAQPEPARPGQPVGRMALLPRSGTSPRISPYLPRISPYLPVSPRGLDGPFAQKRSTQLLYSNERSRGHALRCSRSPRIHAVL